MLVGVSNRPSAYNPVSNYDKAIAKKNEVLNSMLDQKYITKKEYDAAKKEAPQIVEKTDNTDADNYMVSYAIHCATLELMKQAGFQFKYNFDSQSEYKNFQFLFYRFDKSINISVVFQCFRAGSQWRL